MHESTPRIFFRGESIYVFGGGGNVGFEVSKDLLEYVANAQNYTSEGAESIH